MLSKSIIDAICQIFVCKNGDPIFRQVLNFPTRVERNRVVLTAVKTELKTKKKGPIFWPTHKKNYVFHI